MQKKEDEYIWSEYTAQYSDQIISDVVKTNTMLIKNFKIDGNKLIFDELENLHNRWKEIYSLIVEKDVKSVFECGCGSGQHIKNISIIKPDIIVEGCDLLQSQIDWGKEYFKWDEEFIKKIKIIDFTLSEVINIIERKYEFVYSQSVVVHLSYEKAIKFIRNMLNISNKYVLLVEKEDDHDYASIFTMLFNEGYSFNIEKTKNYINNGILLTKGSP